MGQKRMPKIKTIKDLTRFKDGYAEIVVRSVDEFNRAVRYLEAYLGIPAYLYRRQLTAQCYHDGRFTIPKHLVFSTSSKGDKQPVAIWSIEDLDEFDTIMKNRGVHAETAEDLENSCTCTDFEAGMLIATVAGTKEIVMKTANDGFYTMNRMGVTRDWIRKFPDLWALMQAEKESDNPFIEAIYGLPAQAADPFIIDADRVLLYKRKEKKKVISVEDACKLLQEFMGADIQIK